MKIKWILPTIGLLLAGCASKYKFTAKVCDKKIYAEIFNVNPAGVDAAYLTDSVNFRLYIGKYDNEHENFGCECNGDSIEIIKFANDSVGQRKRVDSLTLSISSLIKKKIHDNQPIFEFK
jgi:hypothetical protein